MDEYIHIHRWQDFQHDKRRKGAPWHKEHAAQIDNDAYLDLSLAARGLLMGLRLMYGRRHPEGVSVSNARRLLCATGSDAKYFRVHLESLRNAGFITIGASKLLARRTQAASAALAQEVETEREVETEKDQEQTPTQPNPELEHTAKNGSGGDGSEEQENPFDLERAFATVIKPFPQPQPGEGDFA